MNFIPKSGLQRQLVFYIIFIGIVFLTMAVEMEVFLRGDEILGALTKALVKELPFEIVNRVLLKMRVMLGTLLLAIGLVMMLFVKRIMFPLERIIAGTRAMSTGDFSATLPEQGRDELSELARHINDLNANEQELILLTRSTTGQIRQTLTESTEAGRVETAVQMLDELEETLVEFGKKFYQC